MPQDDMAPNMVSACQSVNGHKFHNIKYTFTIKKLIDR